MHNLLTFRIGASLLVWAMLATGSLGAPPAGKIAGKVTTPAGEPAGAVTVVLTELRRRTTTGEDGAFRFESVPPGTYLLEASSPRSGSGVRQVVVESDATATVEIGLDLSVHRESVVVTAGAGASSSADLAQPVAVLDRQDLAQAIAPSLGESLSQVPGVNSTYYGPAASRPIIRGLGGDHIRVLNNGLGVGDASNVSPDHAVGLDPLASERVEVVRGPATLLYGSDAVAGVVNVLDGRIPDHVPDRPIGGDVLLRAGSVDDAREGALSLHGGARGFAWHLDGLTRETEDFDVPDGTILNSAIDSDGFGVGASWVGTSGYLGASFSNLQSLYGVAVEDEVTIDLDQDRVDVEGAWLRPFGPFSRLVARVGRSDYEHTEFEGPDPGTLFTNDEWEGRAELSHEAGPFKGRFGLQARDRDFEAVGDEKFIDPNQMSSWALFGFENYTRGALDYQLGARFEHQEARSDDPALEDRDFDGATASFGVVWSIQDAWGISTSLTRATRFPTVEELYSNGPHIATLSFEVGDPALDEETSLGFDLALRKRTGIVSGELTLFAQQYDDFIFDEDTGTTVEIEPGEFLPIFQYVQRDAEFLGAEAHVDFELVHAEPHHLQLELRSDIVRAELEDTGTPLPRIPPWRAGLSLSYQGSHLWGQAGALYVAEQDRIGANETPTPDHTLVDASLGYRFFAGSTVHELILRGRNLTDELAQNHASRFKDLVPLPGRDVSLIYRLTF